ncbi:hypothetical protein [Ottowia massiliensis]|uniref:hypothetical protein n=1 Tax=Ottowia massiliensis TaxID=2045302 RepID=UPI0011AFB78F|nr:hypothetical protein [Ottowia massiliensis]
MGSIPASRAKQFPFSHLFIQKAGAASESCAGFLCACRRSFASSFNVEKRSEYRPFKLALALYLLGRIAINQGAKRCLSGDSHSLR